MSECRHWYEGDPILEAYHDHEWCRINHDDEFQFEMLCLEGASVGLSWKIIMHKREAYRRAFHGFRIDACAEMTDEELEAQMSDPGIIRNRTQVELVTAHVLPENKASARCLVKNGFEYLLTKTEDWGYGEPCTADVYTLDC